MDLPAIYYEETEWAKTHTGNKVNKKHAIAGTQNIIIAGKVRNRKTCFRSLSAFQTIIEQGVSIRGDLATVKIGKYCVLKTRCVVRPCLKIFSKKPAMCNVIIGDYVYIEEVRAVLNETKKPFIWSTFSLCVPLAFKLSMIQWQRD